MYDVVIRTRGFTAELEKTIRDLHRQTFAPDRIVVVNSLDDPASTERLRSLECVLVNYFDRPFNYSRAINLGVEKVEAEWLLILSSHVSLDKEDLLQKAVARMDALGARGMCLGNESEYVETLVTRSNFNGRNGLSNSCAYLKTADVRARPFDERLFSAEDQYWAKQHFQAGHSILRIATPEFVYANPHHRSNQPNLRKLANEDVAIAYFVVPRLLLPDYVAFRMLKALVFLALGRFERAVLHWGVAVRLVAAWFREPKADSDYTKVAS